MKARKYGKPRTPRKVILVICEGDTEKAYVDMLRLHYRLPITIKARVVGNRINERLVNQFLKEEGLKGEDDAQVVYIYDADIKPLVEHLKKLSGTLILSDPCIEFWFLLHGRDYYRFISSGEIVDILERSHTVWKGYVKGILTEKQKEFLLTHGEEASARAKLLDANATPGTNVYQFLEILENEKKR